MGKLLSSAYFLCHDSQQHQPHSSWLCQTVYHIPGLLVTPMPMGRWQKFGSMDKQVFFVSGNAALFIVALLWQLGQHCV